MKDEIRKLYKARRQGLNEEEIMESSLAVANKCLTLPIWEYQTYHMFLTIAEQKEIQTEFLLNVLFGKDKTVVVPRSDFKDKTMTSVLLTDNTQLRKNRMNIPEPVNGISIDDKLIDVVFLPLLAFDAKGFRIGYGQGFYDRFLESCNPDVVKIGLSFFDAEESFSVVEEHDKPMNYCVTPGRVYHFSS